MPKGGGFDGFDLKRADEFPNDVDGGDKENAIKTGGAVMLTLYSRFL